MLIRMTGIATGIASLAAAGALTIGAALAPADHPAAPRTALVVDASAARDGRELIDPRLRAVEADVRLPRSTSEARTDVRYFAAQGYDRIVVAGPRSTAAADGASVVRVADLRGALAAIAR
jgi:hypothetical protein